MIKFISIFSVLVFLSSAVRSYAEDTDLDVTSYDNVWTYTNSDGYLSFDPDNESVDCTIDDHTQSGLRVTSFSGSLGFGATFDTPVLSRPSNNSSAVFTLQQGSIVNIEREVNQNFSEISIISSSTDSLTSSQETNYIGKNNLVSIHNHNLTAGFFGSSGEERIKIRLVSQNELGSCTIDDGVNEPFIATYIIFESTDRKNLFLVKQDNLLLLHFALAEFSENISVRSIVEVEPEASEIEKANAELRNSGPDTPSALAWVQRQLPNRAEAIAGVNSFIGSSRTVICTIDQSGVEVLDDNQNPLEGFSNAANGTIATISQEYEPLIIDDVEYLNVIFRDNGRKSGWVPSHAIRSRAECSSLNYPMAQVVHFCTASSGFTRVRDESLDTVITRIPDNTRALVISEEPRNHTINDTEYLFVELSIEGQEETFWAPNKFLSSSTCEVYKEELLREQLANQFFPLLQKPEKSYLQTSAYDNWSAFNGRRWVDRDRGITRTHGASDLWTKFLRSPTDAKRGGEYRSVAAGTVIRDVDPFYEDTYEVAVLDDRTGRIYRYGEVYEQYGDPANGIAEDDFPIEKGNRWVPGQVIGHTKWTEIGGTNPMLHFEMYSSGSSNLTERNSSGLDQQSTLSGHYGRYKRHRNLINPESFLRDLESLADDLEPNESGARW